MINVFFLKKKKERKISSIAYWFNFFNGIYKLHSVYRIQKTCNPWETDYAIHDGFRKRNNAMFGYSFNSFRFRA